MTEDDIEATIAKVGPELSAARRAWLTEGRDIEELVLLVRASDGMTVHVGRRGYWAAELDAEAFAPLRQPSPGLVPIAVFSNGRAVALRWTAAPSHARRAYQGAA